MSDPIPSSTSSALTLEPAGATSTKPPLPAWRQGVLLPRGSDSARSAWGRLPPLARRLLLAVLLLAIWGLYIRLGHVSRLVFASPWAMARAFADGWANGQLASATATTLAVLLSGVAIGFVLAVVFTIWATTTTVGNDLLALLTAVINPLPSIAVLPLAMIWFGVSNTAVLFVVAESVLWPLAINLTSGFSTVNPTLLMVGRNLGLRRWRYVRRVLLPGALPSIISGLNIGWAMAWRTAIAAELVFGTSGGNGGIGYYINTSQYFLKIPDVFAGLATIAVVGFAVQMGFSLLERRTIVRWGMKADR